jgi:drug/metabolite transporter (DMT)-like permease
MALYLALVLFWSSGFIGATMAAETGASAGTTLLWRFLLTAGILVVIAGARRRRYRLDFLAREATIGLLAQGLYLYGVFSAATLGVATGTNALIASLQPLLVAVVASHLAGSRLQGRTLLGLISGLAGVAVVAGADLGSGRGGMHGIAMVAMGMLALSVGTLLAERWSLPSGTDLLDRLTVHAVVALGFFTALAVPTGGLQAPADPMFWWAQLVVVLGAFVGGYGSYLLVLQRSGPVVASALLYLTPGTSAAIAWLAFGEALSPVVLMGFALSSVGVVTILRARREPPSKGQDSTRVVALRPR